MIKSKPCKFILDTDVPCGSTWHTAYYHKPKKPIITRKRAALRSAKEQLYQVWKEEVARPYLIERDGNRCNCCKRPASTGEKLDIEHTLGKGSHPSMKKDLDNLTLMCRWPCHYNKTNHIACLHV